jgi:hypothetical protein
MLLYTKKGQQGLKSLGDLALQKATEQTPEQKYKLSAPKNTAVASTTNVQKPLSSKNVVDSAQGAKVSEKKILQALDNDSGVGLTYADLKLAEKILPEASYSRLKDLAPKDVLVDLGVDNMSWGDKLQSDITAAPARMFKDPIRAIEDAVGVGEGYSEERLEDYRNRVKLEQGKSLTPGERALERVKYRANIANVGTAGVGAAAQGIPKGKLAEYLAKDIFAMGAGTGKMYKNRVLNNDKAPQAGVENLPNFKSEIKLAESANAAPYYSKKIRKEIENEASQRYPLIHEGNIDSYSKSYKDELKKYAETPIFKKRAEESFKNIPGFKFENYKNKFLKNLEGPAPKFESADNFYAMDAMGHYTPFSGKVVVTPGARESTLLHEMQHQAKDGDNLLPPWLKKESSKNVQESKYADGLDTEYLGTPAEFDARIGELRRDLKDLIGYDYTKGNIPQQKFEDFLDFADDPKNRKYLSEGTLDLLGSYGENFIKKGLDLLPITLPFLLANKEGSQQKRKGGILYK